MNWGRNWAAQIDTSRFCCRLGLLGFSVLQDEGGKLGSPVPLGAGHVLQWLISKSLSCIAVGLLSGTDTNTQLWNRTTDTGLPAGKCS